MRPVHRGKERVAVCCVMLQCVAACSYISCMTCIWDLCIAEKTYTNVCLVRLLQSYTHTCTHTHTHTHMHTHVCTRTYAKKTYTNVCLVWNVCLLRRRRTQMYVLYEMCVFYEEDVHKCMSCLIVWHQVKMSQCSRVLQCVAVCCSVFLYVVYDLYFNTKRRTQMTYCRALSSFIFFFFFFVGLLCRSLFWCVERTSARLSTTLLRSFLLYWSVVLLSFLFYWSIV